jgi:hypothetical protein
MALAWVRTFIAAALGISAALVSATALAAPSATDRATAQALFEQALSMMEKGQAAEACPKLEESQRLDPGVGTLLYLADCYESVGRTASAWATFLDAAYFAQDAGQADRQKIAEDNATRLKAGLSKLVVVVSEPDLTGLAIENDRQALNRASWGTEVPVDPGTHEIRASAPERETWLTTLQVPKGVGVTTVQVPKLSPLKVAPAPVVAAAPAAPVQGAAAAPQDAPPAAEPSSQRLWGWVALGAGGAALIGGGVFAFLAVSDNGRADQQCRQDNPGLCGETGVELADSAGTKATLAGVFGGVGAAFAITGAVLLITAPDDEHAAGLRVGAIVAHQPRIWLEQTW